MNVLFLTLLGFDSLNERGIYTDLLREFVKNGHNLYVISAIERREGKKSYINEEKNAKILRLQIGNIQKTNVIEKGFSTLMIESQYKRAIQKYYSDVKFDLIIYSTPPITFVGAIEYVKARDNAKTYLLLKDIFPQNAVDIGLMEKTGIKGWLYRHFRKQEKQLYALSDRIGCMSSANVSYILAHNPEINSENVEVCPNCIEVFDKSIDIVARERIRNKYGIPLDKKVFVYGGNLGRPQCIPFLIECLNECKDIEEAFFLVVGDGTDYSLIENYYFEKKQKNLKLLRRLPKEDFDSLVGACDVGMIFLDHRFTIPNFPSRLLSYMQAKLPVLAVTDPNTDIGEVIETNGFGWWLESDNSVAFGKKIRDLVSNSTVNQGIAGYTYLVDNYSSEQGFNIICNGN